MCIHRSRRGLLQLQGHSSGARGTWAAGVRSPNYLVVGGSESFEILQQQQL